MISKYIYSLIPMQGPITGLPVYPDGHGKQAEIPASGANVPAGHELYQDTPPLLQYPEPQSQ